MKLQGRNLSFRMRGDDVASLQKELRQLGLTVQDRDGYFGVSTKRAVLEFQHGHDLRPTGKVDASTAAALTNFLNKPGEIPPQNEEEFTVEGKVTSPFRAGVNGLTVKIVDRNVGVDVPLAEAVTAENGTYSVTFTYAKLRRRKKQAPDLQAHASRNGTLLGVSEVRYNASARERLDIQLDEQASAALPAEYESLIGDLSQHFGERLGDLVETQEQPDITYLANKTGWDARAVAFAALADQFSARTARGDRAGIAPPYFYALFRAGLPANEAALYRVNSQTAEVIWQKAIAQGVIPSQLADNLPYVIEQFQKLTVQHTLDAPALIGVSSMREMLSLALGNDPGAQGRFAELYAHYQADPNTFWQKIGTEFGEPMVQRLKLDGQLAYLTLNNAPLMRQLHEEAGANGLTEVLDLVKGDYYRAEKWQKLTAQSPIPPQISGDNAGGNYNELLATQLRLSFPTAVVAQMVASGETPVTSKELAASVHDFLWQHQGNFEIGMQPIEQYCALNNLHIEPAVSNEITRIQRVHQITPSDGAMNALLHRGVDSAYAAVRYNRDAFVQAFKDVMGEEDASLVYDKAEQVHNAVLNVVFSYLTASTAPSIGMHSPAGILDTAPTPPTDATGVIAYPTLEKLFGSMDFCACDHCRSILSPAAYLVDLLQFIDRPDKNPSPLDILLKRRPDIRHLPLNCENTNTALPYIDVVNETLEYFVANTAKNPPDLSMNGYLGHDTGNTASEDLLASPQFVNDKAYKTAFEALREAYFPVSLPFHQPLEGLRQYFSKMEVPLPLAMETLRKDDALERGTNPYGWRDIWMEELGLSRAEYGVLTGVEYKIPTDPPKPVPLWKMYGFPAETPDKDVIAGIPNFTGLANAKQFARRMEITYDDLISILQTRFVNPGSTLIPKLERLRVSFATLAALHSQPQVISDDDFNKLLPSGAAAIDVTEFGGDRTAWENDKRNYAKVIRTWLDSKDSAGIANVDKIMELITLALPIVSWASGTPYRIGDCIRPASLPDESTLYYVCTKSGTSGNSGLDSSSAVAGKPCQDGTVDWVCRDELSSASFDDIVFCYPDPGKLKDNIDAVAFVRLLRFIRLWKKLGWTIEQTDAAICALYRADLAPLAASDVGTVDSLNAGFLTLLPRLGIIVRVMRELNLTPKRDLLPLLACWSDISTHGRGALYHQMFLNPAILKQDPVFDDNGYGEFLTDANQKLHAHSEALRSAFNLTGQEYMVILAALGIDTAEVAYDHPEPTLEQEILVTAPGIGYDKDRKQLTYTGFLSDKVRDALETVATSAIVDANARAKFSAAVDGLYAANHVNLASLTLSRISAIYRRGWLARQLKISVRELLLLMQLSGLDPYATPDPTNPTLLQLISLVQALRDRSLKSEAALYLIWNQDLSGKSAPDPAQVTELARSLRADFTVIEEQFAVIEDPGGDIARARVALVYGQEATDAFFALLEDVIVLDVTYTHPSEKLETAITKEDNRIAYDDFRHRLSHTGLMTDLLQNKLNDVPGVTPDFTAAIQQLRDKSDDARDSFFTRYKELKEIYDKRAMLAPNVDYTHPTATLEAAITAADSQITYDNAAHRLSYTGILTGTCRDRLKNVPSVTPTFQTAVDALFQKGREELLAALRPDLTRRRKRQQAWQRIATAANTDVSFMQAFLDAASKPYPLHAKGDIERPALDDVLALEAMPGLAERIFYHDTATGVEDEMTTAVANLDYVAKGNPLPANPAAGQPVSGIWSGLLEAPEAGVYNIVIEADAGAKVTLSLGGQASPLTPSGNLWRNSTALELKAGTLYEIVLTVEKVKDRLGVKWETPKRSRETIPARYLYPQSIIATFADLYVRLLKTASLATGLGLSVKEIVHFATDADYRVNDQGQIDAKGQSWLNSLPNADNLHLTDAQAGAVAKTLNATLLIPLRALLEYARIKADIGRDDESLLTVLQDPVVATEKADSLLFTLTRWDRVSLAEFLKHFGSNMAGLHHLDLFRRVYDAFTLIRKMGIGGSTLIQATTNEPVDQTVPDLQASLRARYDAAAWRDVVKPISDRMRGLQRDALVAYILHRMHSNPDTAPIDTVDKLFEYFLMDVQMEPCMQTSRIRHALSSVQLFIERCLMNLEPEVAASAIEAKQWAWMKRYRVWEANRKVFLYPENWLEPELRDDKSPFFKEIESELLQSDITEETAATALLNYLSKLEEVAKLESCGIYHVPATKRKGEVDHVIARTAGAHRKYYYCRYEGGSWTPWEQIKLDIEDNPVIPVVWQDRLFVFWLRVLKETPLKPPQNVPPLNTNKGQGYKEPETHERVANLSAKDLTKSMVSTIQTEVIGGGQDPSESPKINVKAILCYSEYYNGKWQPTRTSDINASAPLGSFPPTGTGTFDRSQYRLAAREEPLPENVERKSLMVVICDRGKSPSSAFRLYNTHSQPQHIISNYYRPSGKFRWFDNANFPFTIRYEDSNIAAVQPTISSRQTVLKPSGIALQYRLVEPPLLQNAWDEPFFFEDSKHVFLVKTTEHLQPMRAHMIGVGAASKRMVSIPRLVLPAAVKVWAKPWGPGGPIGPDPVLIERFVTEDAYIRRGIASGGAVIYGESQIGPAGPIGRAATGT